MTGIDWEKGGFSMDLSDSAAVQRIWQRVGLTPQPGPPSATPSAPSITPGTPDALPDCLPQWIAAEQVSCRRCQAMARCAGAQEAKMLCCLARRSADHARQLQAVYYVLTGQCCCPDAAPTDSLCCGPAQLRQTIQAAQAAQAAYLRHIGGPYGAVFSRLAQAKAAQMDGLLRLLARQNLQNCAGKSSYAGV